MVPANEVAIVVQDRRSLDVVPAGASRCDVRVWVKLGSGAKSRSVGRVSMDSTAVDVTKAGNIGVGDTVALWGDRLPMDDVACAAGTISNDLLTSLTHRVSRMYVA